MEEFVLPGIREGGECVFEEGEMKDRQQWMELCRQASVEQDPKKLLELTAEIIRLLDEKENRLINHQANKPEGDPTPQP